MVFKNLHPCALDESSLSFGRVNISTKQSFKCSQSLKMILHSLSDAFTKIQLCNLLRHSCDSVYHMTSFFACTMWKQVKYLLPNIFTITTKNG